MKKILIGLFLVFLSTAIFASSINSNNASKMLCAELHVDKGYRSGKSWINKEKITKILKYKIDLKLRCSDKSPLAMAIGYMTNKYNDPTSKHYDKDDKKENQETLYIVNSLIKYGFKDLKQSDIDYIFSKAKVTNGRDYWYVVAGFKASVKILQQLNINVDTTNYVKSLDFSSYYEYSITKLLPEVIKYLPNLNVPIYYDSFTLLIWASKNNKYKFAKQLIELGADTKPTDEKGYTALSYAEINKNKNMIKLIKGGVSGKQTGLDKLLAKKNSKPNYNSFALIIGINKYMDETNVEYADNSAKSFKLLAQNVLGVPKENIIYLTNEKATSGQIKSNIELISQLVEDGSTIYFYYAGHGVPATNGKTYLLPSDMKADNIEIEKGLAISNIYDKLSKSPAKKVVVFMDSCFSGKDDSGKLLYKGVAPVLRNKKAKIDKTKLSVFSAGSSSDFANQYKDEEQRMFSYFVIKGLLDGKKNSDELSNYVKMSVKRKSLRLGLSYKQVPQYDGKKSLEIVQ